MKPQILPWLVTIAFLSCSHVSAQRKFANQAAIEFGKWDTVQSTILGEARSIMIYTPDGPEDAKYPVVYLLDGDGHYYSVSGMIRQLSSINGNTVLPKMIVVAIPNTNRTRDLTPMKGDPSQAFADSSLVAKSGGGENFMAFIEKELIPYIESKHSTLPYRILIGHSFGGLTVMNTWWKHTELFNAYIAIDPSMWWANQALIEEIKQGPIGKQFERASLSIAIANTMKKGMDTLRVQQDLKPETEHIRALLDLHKYLEKQTDLDYMGKYYDEDSHGSVPLIAEYDALRFIFADYNLQFGPEDVLNPDVDYSIKMRAHYEQATAKYGFPVLPDESFINMVGFYLMSQQNNQKAHSFFQMNVDFFPESSRAHDSMGDCLMAMGKKKEAIKYFKKSVALNPQSPAKEKLARME